ncbi:hypothetical protein DL93DRAFT_1568303 [Clavulina sp. PMI_390]|nr:hypothetical protein DL93DRAFT_1568303 [Clavulina sp. PMI_390]
MSDDAPPSYDEAKAREFEKELAKAFLDESVRGQFVLDIDRFTSTTNDLLDKFRTVGDKLKEFDDLGLGNEGSTPLNKTWAGYRERFVKLLNDSRSLAGEIADSCDVYLKVIVKPVANLPTSATEEEKQLKGIEALLREIDTFCEEGEEIEQKASTMRDAFSTLAEDIKSFRDGFEKYGEKRKLANKEKMDNIDKEIEKLNDDLKELQGKITKLTYAMVGTGVATGVLATATAFFPLASLAIFIVGLIAVTGEGIALAVLNKQASDIHDNIRGKQKQKANLVAENNKIDTIRTDLAQLNKNQIEGVLNSLEFFRVLWAQISSDVQSIKTYLEKIKKRADRTKPGDEYPASVFSFLKTGTTLTYGLSRGLKLYNIGVERADAIKFGIPVD